MLVPYSTSSPRAVLNVTRPVAERRHVHLDAHPLPQQIAGHGSLLADVVVEGERVQCDPAQPSHEVSNQSDIFVTGRPRSSG
jgi:hypothetical protein